MTALFPQPTASLFRLTSPPSWAAGVADALRARETPIVVALSGGIDSVAMLLLAAHSGAPVLAVHVHHHLRADAHHDAAQALLAARHVGVPCHVLHLDGEALRAPGNVAAASRHARYIALGTIARPLGATVLTAHHVEDLLETMVLRLDQGAGLAGVFGLRADTVITQTPIHRPLLSQWKNDLRTLVATAGVGWAEDSSNASRAYQRNRIRTPLAALTAELQSPARFAASLVGAAREAWALDRSIVKRSSVERSIAVQSLAERSPAEPNDSTESTARTEGDVASVRVPSTQLFDGEVDDATAAARLLRAIDRRGGARPRRDTLEQVIAALRAKERKEFHDQKLRYRCDPTGVSLTTGGRTRDEQSARDRAEPVPPKRLHVLAATDVSMAIRTAPVGASQTLVADALTSLPAASTDAAAACLYTYARFETDAPSAGPLRFRLQQRRGDERILSLRSGTFTGVGKRLARDSVPRDQRDDVWLVVVETDDLERLATPLPPSASALGASVIIGYLCAHRTCVTVRTSDRVVHQIRLFPSQNRPTGS